MSYEKFTDLVQAETTLRRDLHRCPPREAHTLARAIESIHGTLRACPSYHDFLRRLAFTAEALG